MIRIFSQLPDIIFQKLFKLKSKNLHVIQQKTKFMGWEVGLKKWSKLLLKNFL